MLKSGAATSLVVFATGMILLIAFPLVAQQPLPSIQDRITKLEARLRVLEVLHAAFEREAQRVVHESERSVEEAQRLLTAMEVWLGVVTLLFGAVLFMGWQELRLLRARSREAIAASRDARNSANAAAAALSTATAAAGQATQAAAGASSAETASQQAAARLNETVKAGERAVADLKRAVAEAPPLPDLERRGILGEPPEPPSAGAMERYEQADIILVFAEKAGTLPPEVMADAFLRLGLYWRLIENYPRAIARLKTAVSINPQSVAARRELAGALYVLAAHTPSGKAKDRLLGEAEVEILAVQEIAGPLPELSFDLGWIADERGNFEEAVRFYQQAIDMLGPGGPVRPNFTYNLACAYAKGGRYVEALNELAKVIDVDQNWIDAANDRDFAGLRDDPIFGPRIQTLIESARARHKSANNSSP